MTKAPKTDTERLADIQAEIARLEARASKQKAVIRAKEARTRQRRAFLLGECLLSQEALPDAVTRELGRMLDEFLKRPADREILADWLVGAGGADARQALVADAADTGAETPRDLMEDAA